MTIVASKIVFAIGTDTGGLTQATVQVVGFTQFEQVEITNRNGEKIRVDKDALEALIIALRTAQDTIRFKQYEVQS